MNPQWQRQQEQMRRRQMEGAYWQQQQKAKAQKAQAAAWSSAEDMFVQTETEVARLRQELLAGRISEKKFKEYLRELMVQDPEGTWWMMGVKSGEWYRHDGTDWIPAQPPTLARGATSPQAKPKASTPTKAKPRRLLGVVILLVGLGITFAAGMGAGSASYEVLQEIDYTIADPGSLILAGAVWLTGLILTLIVTRKVWRRR